MQGLKLIHVSKRGNWFPYTKAVNPELVGDSGRYQTAT